MAGDQNKEKKQMKRLGTFLSMAVMGGAMLAGTSLMAADWTGTVSDAMCGKDHGGKPADKCTMGCVKKGSAFALVVGDKVYTLEGKTEGLDKLAGAKAKVTGKLAGDKITVESVAAAS